MSGGGGPLQQYRVLARGGAIKPDAAQERAAARLDELHHALAHYRPGGGLLGFLGQRAAPPAGVYICGDVGRGKSMLMDLLFDGAPVRRKRRAHFHAFMLEFHDAVHEWRQMDRGARAKRLRALGLKGDADDPIPPVARAVAERATLLCFDEFQVTDVADAMILGRLFEALFSFGVVVVATSNVHPDHLYDDGLNRQLFLPFIELLKQRMDVLVLEGETDYRLERLKGRPVYYAPLDEAAAAAMDAAWRDLTDTAAGEPCRLDLKGRTLTIPEHARGAARISFAALCEQPLGAADYLAIAHTFHTLFLDGIPEMGPDKRNEAKRFVTLIDALYENRTKLIASAQVPPARLYPAGDGAEAFQRTVSRLMEMQSDTYLRLSHEV